MADYSDIIKDIGDIPNYLINDDLRKIINIGIYDAIRHSNNIGKKSVVIFNITIHEKIGTSRNIRCETSFMGDIPSEYNYDPINEDENGIIDSEGETNETPHENNTKIIYPLVRRTSVEPNKQADIVNIDITFED